MGKNTSHTIKNQHQTDDTRYIKRLIGEGEHQHLDFKFEVNDSRKIARTLVAFANTEGGKLLIGVKDNGSITGVRSDEEYYMVEAASQMYCKPVIPVKATRWIVDGKTVLEIEVKKHPQVCYVKEENAKLWAYVRVEDQNIQANSVWLKYQQRKRDKRSSIIEYSGEQQLLIQYLTQHDCITQQKLMQLAHITSNEAEKLLVEMLALHIIAIQLNEKEANYSLLNKN